MTEPAPCVAMEEMVSIHAPGVRVVDVPLVEANEETFAPYGRIVHDYAGEEVWLTQWPARGRRTVEAGTGRGGGTVEGAFEMERRGDLMLGRNEAVGGYYVTGWFADPLTATPEGTDPDPSRVLVREANYHPDGGQVFFPRDGAAFVALLALPGDDVQPEDFVGFTCDGSFGIQIRPDVWHQPVFPTAPRASFDNKQGAVHACVAIDFVVEYSCYLSVSLRPEAGAAAPRRRK